MGHQTSNMSLYTSVITKDYTDISKDVKGRGRVRLLAPFDRDDIDYGHGGRIIDQWNIGKP